MITIPLSSIALSSVKGGDTNKYCKMTTIDMLERCKSDYQHAHDKLLIQLDDISERYYKTTEIPPEVVKKITNMNKDVLEIEKIIDDILSAIKVIDVEL